MIKTLKDVAEFLNLNNVSDEIDAIVSSNGDEVYLPLVGEFNAGKTSLINALLESCKLPFSNEPTTSTLFQIRFGNSTPSASLVKTTGEVINITDMETLSDGKIYDNVVMVYINDTAKSIPSNIVLVDSPGISSIFEEHTKAIADFVPHADALLVVVDAVKGNITSSLDEFLRVTKVAQKPSYLVFTKAGLHSAENIRRTRDAAKRDYKNFSQVVFTDSSKGWLDEFYSLIETIEKDADKILANSRQNKLESIKMRLMGNLDDYIHAISANNINPSKVKDELKALKENIDYLFGKIDTEVKRTEDGIVEELQETIGDKLDSIGSQRTGNFNGQARQLVENEARYAYVKYKQKIVDNLNSIPRTMQTDISSSKEFACIVDELTKIDLSELPAIELTFDRDLNAIGHGYDAYIAKGVKIAAAAALVVATGGQTAPLLVPALASDNTIADPDVDTVADPVVDTVIDTASVLPTIPIVNGSSSKVQRVVTKAKDFVDRTTEAYDTIERENVRYGEQFGFNKGILNSAISAITSAASRPKRLKVINEYLEKTLVPELKNQLLVLREETLRVVKQQMQTKAQEMINNKEQLLKSIQQQSENSAANLAKAEKYIEQLKS